MISVRHLPWLAATLVCIGAGPAGAGHLPYTGLNISGGEYGHADGRPETDFTLPNAADIAFVASHGFTTLRVPFLWERLQPALNGPLDPAELARLHAVVALARDRGLRTVLDVHNYARYRTAVIGSDAAPISAFAAFWGALAKDFTNEPSVVFGLMNEPHDMATETWAAAAQAALQAIRAAGASQLVLVPGNGYTGAHSWTTGGYGTPNAVAMRGITDPCGAMAFEFHQYADADSSGTAATCSDPRVVGSRLADATAWLRKTGNKGFLAEFGAGPDATCQAGLSALLRTMDANSDVWIGWTYWAAGRWWPATYPLSVQPDAGRERPQMAILRAATGASRPPAPRACAHPASARTGAADAPVPSTRP